MKWKFFIVMVGLTLVLSIVNALVFQIPLLIIAAPLLLGTIVISISTIIQLGIVIIIWILFYVLVRGI